MPEYGTAATEVVAKPLSLFVLRSQNGDSGPDTASPSITSLPEIALHASLADRAEDPTGALSGLCPMGMYCHVNTSHDWCLAMTGLAMGRRYEAMTELYRWKGYIRSFKSRSASALL